MNIRNITKRLMLLALPLSLMLASCNEQDPASIKVLDKATGETIRKIEAGCQATQYELVVIADNWTAESSADWCVLSRKEGHYGQENVNLVISNSTNNTSREAIVTFRSGLAQHILLVSQSKENEFIHIMPAAATVGYKAGTISFTVNANFSWTAGSVAEWARVTSPSNGIGNGTQNVTIAFDENAKHGESRMTNIIIKSAEGEEIGYYSLTQKGRGEANLDVAAEAYSFDQAGGTTSIAIFHNLINPALQAASSDVTWCTASIVGQAVKITATANASNNERFAIVTVAGEVNGVAVVKQIKVSQVGAVAPKLTLSRESVVMDQRGNSVAVEFVGPNAIATSNVGWLTVAVNGNKIELSAGENTAKDVRVATVTVVAKSGSKTTTKYITVMQNGVNELQASIAPAVATIDGMGGELKFSIHVANDASNVEIIWEADAMWCNYISGNVIDATYEVEMNPGVYERECVVFAWVMVGDQSAVASATVKQAYLGN